MARDMVGSNNCLLHCRFFLGENFLAYWQNYLMAYIGLHVIAICASKCSSISGPFHSIIYRTVDRETSRTLYQRSHGFAQVVARTPIYLVRDGLTA